MPVTEGWYEMMVRRQYEISRIAECRYALSLIMTVARGREKPGRMGKEEDGMACVLMVVTQVENQWS